MDGGDGGSEGENSIENRNDNSDEYMARIRVFVSLDVASFEKLASGGGVNISERGSEANASDSRSSGLDEALPS